MRVSGNLGRPDTEFTGEVVKNYTIKLHGVDVPMVAVLCDNGKTCYTYAKDVVEIQRTMPTLAYAVSRREFNGREWETLVSAALSFAGAHDRYSVYKRIGAGRDAQIIRDPSNDGQQLGM